jgi:hypothetical protein
VADYSAYAEERLRLWRRLRQELGGASLGELFRPSAAELRFRLGTSLADLRIPFKIGQDVRAAFDHAAIIAYLLAGQRHKSSLNPGEYDKLVMVEGFDPNLLRSLSFNLPPSVTRDPVRRAFTQGMDSHAGLDAGLLSTFLGTDQAGRKLAATCHALLTKARDEGRRSETAEPTIYLLALMLRASADSALGLMKEGPIGEPAGRFVRGIVSVLLSQALLLALREAGLLRDAGIQAGMTPAPGRDLRESRACLLATAALGLQSCLGQRVSFAGTGLTAYGVQFDSAPPRVDEARNRLNTSDEPELVARDIAGALMKDKDQQRRMERAGALAILRDKVRELALLMETVRGATVTIPGEGTIDKILIGRESLERLFTSDARRKEVARVAKEAARQAGHAGIRERLDLLAHAAREYRDDDPAAWVGAFEARLRASRAVTALAADLLIERAVMQAQQLLLERSGTETEGGEAAEYESGRLYLVSVEDRPFLRSRVRAPQVAHLFCDLKDFTRRTAALKENVIADFLQREFYSPMLALASGLDPGSRVANPGSGITLNNLVGDAASFSGDIVALMRLSREIRAAFRTYGQRLESEASQEAVAASIQDIETRYKSRRESLERNARELLARAPQAEPSMREAMLARAQEARSEIARLDAAFESEKTRTVGEKLEAGVFISYGAAPEVARFDDPVFGALRVAIAEKINESARGTSRNASVRDRIEVLRQRAVRNAGKPLELPFSVFVETPSTIALTPGDALALADAIDRGDEMEADMRLRGIVLQALQRPGKMGDIFNNGIACSEEALNAYLEARFGEAVVLQKDVAVSSLHESIRDRFFFPRDPFRLVMCVSASRALADLFVFQGKATFRGFESTGGLGIYEVLDRGSALFQALGIHHLPHWLREAGDLRTEATGGPPSIARAK